MAIASSAYAAFSPQRDSQMTRVIVVGTIANPAPTSLSDQVRVLPQDAPENPIGPMVFAPSQGETLPAVGDACVVVYDENQTPYCLWFAGTYGPGSGPTGPAGPTGPTGLTGATGPAGPAVVDWLNVTESPYTADPTGAVDSTSTIQAAINAASTSSQVVYVPPGLYKITAPLVLEPGTRLIGDSRPGYTVVGGQVTRLQASGSAFDSLIQKASSTPFYDMAIEGLWLDCNATANYGIHWEGSGTAGACFVDKCIATGASAHGFYADGSTGAVDALFFSDCFSVGNTDDGFHFAGSSFDNHMHHCVAQFNASGFVFDGTSATVGTTVVEGCRSEGNSLHGYAVIDGTEGMQFYGSFSDSNGKTGWYLSGQYYTDDMSVVIDHCFQNRDGLLAGATQPAAGIYLNGTTAVINGCVQYPARADTGNGLWGPAYGLYAVSSTAQVTGCRLFGVLGGWGDGGSNTVTWG